MSAPERPWTLAELPPPIDVERLAAGVRASWAAEGRDLPAHLARTVAAWRGQADDLEHLAACRRAEDGTEPAVCMAAELLCATARAWRTAARELQRLLGDGAL